MSTAATLNQCELFDHGLRLKPHLPDLLMPQARHMSHPYENVILARLAQDDRKWALLQSVAREEQEKIVSSNCFWGHSEVAITRLKESTSSPTVFLRLVHRAYLLTWVRDHCTPSSLLGPRASYPCRKDHSQDTKLPFWPHDRR